MKQPAVSSTKEITTKLCIFFSSFIRLADYLIVNTMHVLAVNSVSTLLNYLKEQLQNTPTLAEIQGLEEAEKEGEEKDEKVGFSPHSSSIFLPNFYYMNFLYGKCSKISNTICLPKRSKQKGKSVRNFRIFTVLRLEEFFFQKKSNDSFLTLNFLNNIFHLLCTPIVILVGQFIAVMSMYSKSCVKQPLAKRPKNVFQDQISHNAG